MCWLTRSALFAARRSTNASPLVAVFLRTPTAGAPRCAISPRSVKGRDANIDWKALSHRIGHSDVAFTMKQYVQTDVEADRQVANTLAELIIGGSLASTAVASLADHMQKALSLFEKGPLALVAGEGFEPSTSGL